MVTIATFDFDEVEEEEIFIGYREYIVYLYDYELEDLDSYLEALDDYITEFGEDSAPFLDEEFLGGLTSNGRILIAVDDLKGEQGEPGRQGIPASRYVTMANGAEVLVNPLFELDGFEGDAMEEYLQENNFVDLVYGYEIRMLQDGNYSNSGNYYLTDSIDLTHFEAASVWNIDDKPSPVTGQPGRRITDFADFVVSIGGVSHIQLKILFDKTKEYTILIDADTTEDVLANTDGLEYLSTFIGLINAEGRYDGEDDLDYDFRAFTKEGYLVVLTKEMGPHTAIEMFNDNVLANSVDSYNGTHSSFSEFYFDFDSIGLYSVLNASFLKINDVEGDTDETKDLFFIEYTLNGTAQTPVAVKIENALNAVNGVYNVQDIFNLFDLPENSGLDIEFGAGLIRFIVPETDNTIVVTGINDGDYPGLTRLLFTTTPLLFENTVETRILYNDVEELLNDLFSITEFVTDPLNLLNFKLNLNASAATGTEDEMTVELYVDNDGALNFGTTVTSALAALLAAFEDGAGSDVMVYATAPDVLNAILLNSLAGKSTPVKEEFDILTVVTNLGSLTIEDDLDGFVELSSHIDDFDAFVQFVEDMFTDVNFTATYDAITGVVTVDPVGEDVELTSINDDEILGLKAWLFNTNAGSGISGAGVNKVLQTIDLRLVYPVIVAYTGANSDRLNITLPSVFDLNTGTEIIGSSNGFGETSTFFLASVLYGRQYSTLVYDGESLVDETNELKVVSLPLKEIGLDDFLKQDILEYLLSNIGDLELVAEPLYGDADELDSESVQTVSEMDSSLPAGITTLEDTVLRVEQRLEDALNVQASSWIVQANDDLADLLYMSQKVLDMSIDSSITTNRLQIEAMMNQYYANYMNRYWFQVNFNSETMNYEIYLTTNDYDADYDDFDLGLFSGEYTSEISVLEFIGANAADSINSDLDLDSLTLTYGIEFDPTNDIRDFMFDGFTITEQSENEDEDDSYQYRPSPISNYYGEFNGMGYSLHNWFAFDIDAGSGRWGLFGTLEDATIRNLALIDPYLELYGSDDWNFGIIAGYAENTLFTNVHVFDELNLLGGLLSESYDLLVEGDEVLIQDYLHEKFSEFDDEEVFQDIDDLQNEGIRPVGLYVDDGINVGGLVGKSRGMMIINSSNQVKVEGDDNSDRVGGLIGKSEENLVIFNSHVSSTAIIGDTHVGGLVGYLTDNNETYVPVYTYIENSFVYGTTLVSFNYDDVNYDHGEIGGLVGEVYLFASHDLSILNSFALTNIVSYENGVIGGLIGKIYTSTNEYATVEINIDNSYSIINYLNEDEDSDHVGGMIGEIDFGGPANFNTRVLINNSFAMIDKSRYGVADMGGIASYRENALIIPKNVYYLNTAVDIYDTGDYNQSDDFLDNWFGYTEDGMRAFNESTFDRDFIGLNREQFIDTFFDNDIDDFRFEKTWDLDTWIVGDAQDQADLFNEDSDSDELVYWFNNINDIDPRFDQDDYFDFGRNFYIPMLRSLDNQISLEASVRWSMQHYLTFGYSFTYPEDADYIQRDLIPIEDPA